MSRRKQLLVLSTTVPLLMFGATVGMAAQKDFSICDEVPRTGGAYGLCRAGVAVGCVDGTGNAQACANIEEHYLTVTDQSAPWVCPCNFESVPKASPSSPFPGPWGGSEQSQITCLVEYVVNDDILSLVIYDTVPGFETKLQAGLIANSLSCSIEEGGEPVPGQAHMGLDEVQTANCVSKLNTYWSGLKDAWEAGEIVGMLDDCPDAEEM